MGDRGSRPARRHGTARPAALAAGLLLAATLTGCDDAAAPARLGPTAGTSPPPASSSSTPTSRRAQVEAAVREYYAAMDHAIRTGDTSHLRRASHPECECRDLIPSIERVFHDGATTGAGVHLRHVDVEVLGPQLADARVDVTTDAYALIDADGSITDRFPSGRDRAVLTLTRPGSEWRVARVLFLDRNDLR